MFTEYNTISGNKFGRGYRSVNFPVSYKKQNRAANVTLHSDIVSSRTGFQTVGIYHSFFRV